MDIFSRAGMRECGFIILLAVNSFRSCVDTLPNVEQGDAIKSPAPPAFILKDINTWPASSMATVFATNGERVFIDGGGRLWSSDGTTEGTVNLGPFWIPDLDMYGSVQQALEEYAVVLGDRLVYRAADPEHGAELWASDGTSEGTGLLGHLFLGSPGQETLPCEGGTASSPGAGDLALADVNGDGRIDLSDPVSILGFLFLGGPPPALGPDCVRIEGCPEQAGCW